MERSGTLGNYKRWPRSEGAAESLRRQEYRNSFQGDLDCGDDLLWQRVSTLPLFPSGVNNNTYTQGSATLTATLHPGLRFRAPLARKAPASSWKALLEPRKRASIQDQPVQLTIISDSSASQATGSVPAGVG